MFQSYAIWPHMTVYENVALPLWAHGVPSAQAQARVAELLNLVGLDGLAERSATQLFGRATAARRHRALSRQPAEARPPRRAADGNLDARLRVGMRAELRDLQRRLDATMIFVTHDQEEAMSLADEIFLFRSGRLEQHGPGGELYRRPSTRYVAEFFGKANIFRATLHDVSGTQELRPVSAPTAIAVGSFAGRAAAARDLVCMVRPEAWRIGPTEGAGLPGRVAEIMLLGDRLELQLETPIGGQCVVVLGYQPVGIGERVSLTVAPEHVHFLPEEPGA